MAKTESTAVNELIEMVSTQKPLASDPGDDLMFSPPKARMTAPLPVAQGDVAPLPRTRSASGTQTDVPPAPPVRSMTAPPSRGTTIPPLPATSRSSASLRMPPVPTGGSSASLRMPPPVPTGGSSASLKMPPATPTSASSASLKMPPLPSSNSSASLKMPPLPTRTSAPPPRLSGQRATLPPPRTSTQMPVPGPDGTPPPEIQARSAPPPPVRTRSITPPPPSMPVAAPFEPKAEAEQPQHEWFGSSRLMQGKKPAVAKDKDKSGTYQVQRKADTVTLAKKLAVPTAALVLVGVCVGGYFAFDGEGGKKAHAKSAVKVAAADTKVAAADTKVAPIETPTPATPTPATPAPAPTEAAAKPAELTTPPPAAPAPAAPVATLAAAPEVKQAPPNQALAASDTTTIKTSRGEIKLVDVRIDSTPAGATVMLVDRGKTTFLGTTPIATQIETSRSYDVVFTAANHPTQVEHLDPNTTHRMAVTLGKPGNTAAATAVAVAPTPPAEHHHHHHDAPAPTVAAVAPAAHHDAPAARKDPPKKGAIVDPFATAPAPAATGNGTLMVSSKPPCEILVDGKDTGMMTPQRSIPLPAGPHKVTFVNAAQSINKTVGVQIAADKPTKLIQDLMKK